MGRTRRGLGAGSIPRLQTESVHPPMVAAIAMAARKGPASLSSRGTIRRNSSMRPKLRPIGGARDWRCERVVARHGARDDCCGAAFCQQLADMGGVVALVGIPPGTWRQRLGQLGCDRDVGHGAARRRQQHGPAASAHGSWSCGRLARARWQALAPHCSAAPERCALSAVRPSERSSSKVAFAARALSDHSRSYPAAAK